MHLIHCSSTPYSCGKVKERKRTPFPTAEPYRGPAPSRLFCIAFSANTQIHFLTPLLCAPVVCSRHRLARNLSMSRFSAPISICCRRSLQYFFFPHKGPAQCIGEPSPPLPRHAASDGKLLHSQLSWRSPLPHCWLSPTAPRRRPYRPSISEQLRVTQSWPAPR